MAQRPGTPRLIGELNDRTAVDLMLSAGPVTKTRLAEFTGLSKVTAAQLLARLEARGLVQVVGSQEGTRGPSAALYALVPSSGYVAGLHIGPQETTAGVVDITGAVLARLSVDPHGTSDPISLVRGAVTKAARRAGVPMSRVRCLSIGTPGMVDPSTGDVRFAYDLPDWRAGVLEALRRGFRRPVQIENDVNLAAIAERSAGAAKGIDDVVLAWIGRGVGVGVVVNGRLYRGAGGGAGEIGYLPVPGGPLPKGVTNPRKSGFQSLVGADGVRQLARAHGLRGSDSVACVEKALADRDRGPAFLDELAGRIAVGLAGVCVVLDPGMCVLSGDVGRAGGAELAKRVEAAIAGMCPNQPHVVVGEVADDPVLRGALLSGLDSVRDEVFAKR
ncbi:ROK family transcriptional regulator [Solicola gregarius]|uniref:ROK family transcriptional regulator n=1 Tax=Solicola gregarius TaxID=2908642 RepID=A0AA46TGY8_9ACTN|nr:ROK family transcriptional regulator [Solicola gregarius]UYM05169.1 ROK family transcriptional regulator [Solicola gregarius]